MRWKENKSLIFQDVKGEHVKTETKWLQALCGLKLNRFGEVSF